MSSPVRPKAHLVPLVGEHICMLQPGRLVTNLATPLVHVGHGIELFRHFLQRQGGSTVALILGALLA